MAGVGFEPTIFCLSRKLANPPSTGALPLSYPAKFLSRHRFSIILAAVETSNQADKPPNVIDRSNINIVHQSDKLIASPYNMLQLIILQEFFLKILVL